MKVPQLKKKLEIKTCHNIDWEDNYSWIHQDNILEVLKDKNKLDQKVEICEECKKSDDSVLQNLILTGFKICKSCRASKTIFPI